MNKIFATGLNLSKSIFFRRLTKSAGGMLAKPVKVGLMLTEGYRKLILHDSAQSGMSQLKEIGLTVIRMVKAYVNGEYRNIETKSIIVALAVVLYLVTPLDIIPDFLPVVGLMDDLSLMAWFISTFQKEVSKFQEWEASLVVQPS